MSSAIKITVGNPTVIFIITQEKGREATGPTASTNMTRTVEKSTVLLFIHELYTNFIQYR